MINTNSAVGNPWDKSYLVAVNTATKQCRIAHVRYVKDHAGKAKDTNVPNQKENERYIQDVYGWVLPETVWFLSNDLRANGMTITRLLTGACEDGKNA